MIVIVEGIEIVRVHVLGGSRELVLAVVLIRSTSQQFEVMTLHVELVVHGSLKQIVEIVVFDTIQRVGIIISLTNIIASHAIPYQIMALGTTGIIASTATGIQVDAQPLH